MSKIGADGNAADRSLGEYWEDIFIEMAKSYGWSAWAFNRKKGGYFLDEHGNRYTSPDVWILKRGDRQYIVEVKHKNLARNNCYGFELQREESMLAIQENYQNQFGGVRALYAVHNHDLAGGKYEKENSPLHWHAQFLDELSRLGYEGNPQKTYYNGRVTDDPVRMKYYHYRDFRPLDYFLAGDR